MGGDSFQGTQKLTNQQFLTLVPQILTILQPITQKSQSYIPLPQKQMHGDIDILLILKPESTPSQILELLKIQQYIMNNNNTINSVYKNKQVDFCIKKDEKKYELAKFYKSYSGFGAHLGIFLKSREIKLSDQGLFALGYHEHIKFQYLLTDSVEQILRFYGLDYQRYMQGFNTRKELFQYLRGCCFINEKVMVQHDCKNQSKLTKFFTEYVKQQPNIRQQATIVFKDHRKDTLNYFKKQQQFTKQFEQKLSQITRKQNINKKFNAVHIIQKFRVEPRQVNKLKQKFRSNFKDQDQYRQYVESNQVGVILELFQKIVLMVEEGYNGGGQGDEGESEERRAKEEKKRQERQIKLQVKKQKRKQRRAKQKQQKQQDNSNSSQQNKTQQNIKQEQKIQTTAKIQTTVKIQTTTQP